MSARIASAALIPASRSTSRRRVRRSRRWIVGGLDDESPSKPMPLPSHSTWRHPQGLDAHTYLRTRGHAEAVGSGDAATARSELGQHGCRVTLTPAASYLMKTPPMTGAERDARDARFRADVQAVFDQRESVSQVERGRQYRAVWVKYFPEMRESFNQQPELENV